jgi:hypothetical protein
MKQKVMLTASLLLNAFFLWLIFREEPPAPQTRVRTLQLRETNVVVKQFTNFPDGMIFKREGVPVPFEWNLVANDNLEIYRANLRAIGCPETTISAILLGVVGDVHLAQRRAASKVGERLWELSSEGLSQSFDAFETELGPLVTAFRTQVARLELSTPLSQPIAASAQIPGKEDYLFSVQTAGLNFTHEERQHFLVAGISFTNSSETQTLLDTPLDPARLQVLTENLRNPMAVRIAAFAQVYELTDDQRNRVQRTYVAYEQGELEEEEYHSQLILLLGPDLARRFVGGTENVSPPSE